MTNWLIDQSVWIAAGVWAVVWTIVAAAFIGEWQHRRHRNRTTGHTVDFTQKRVGS